MFCYLRWKCGTVSVFKPGTILLRYQLVNLLYLTVTVILISWPPNSNIPVLLESGSEACSLSSKCFVSCLLVCLVIFCWQTWCIRSKELWELISPEECGGEAERRRQNVFSSPGVTAQWTCAPGHGLQGALISPLWRDRAAWGSGSQEFSCSQAGWALVK